MRVGFGPVEPLVLGSPSTGSPVGSREVGPLDHFGAGDPALTWARAEGRSPPEGINTSGSAALLNAATLAHLDRPQNMVPLSSERSNPVSPPSGRAARGVVGSITTQALLELHDPVAAQTVEPPLGEVPSRSELRALVEAELSDDGLLRWDEGNDSSRAALGAQAVRSRLGRLDAPSAAELSRAEGASDPRVTRFLPSLANIYAHGTTEDRIALSREAMGISLVVREAARPRATDATLPNDTEPSRSLEWAEVLAEVVNTPDGSALTPGEQAERAWAYDLAREASDIAVLLPSPSPQSDAPPRLPSTENPDSR